MNDFAVWYTPGVAAPCRAIQEDEDLAYEYTSRGNTVAVISDSTRPSVGEIASSEASTLPSSAARGVKGLPWGPAANKTSLVFTIALTYASIELPRAVAAKLVEALAENLAKAAEIERVLQTRRKPATA